jgi:hypothetical protein
MLPRRKKKQKKNKKKQKNFDLKMKKGIFSSLFFGNALIKMAFKMVLAFDVFALAQHDNSMHSECLLDPAIELVQSYLCKANNSLRNSINVVTAD